MYVPTHFGMDDEAVRQLLMHRGAGELITFSEAVGLQATLLPFNYEAAEGAYGTLHGHVARNNDQWRHAPGSESGVGGDRCTGTLRRGSAPSHRRRASGGGTRSPWCWPRR